MFCRVGLPYRLVGGVRLLDRPAVRDAVGYLRAIVDPDNDESLAAIINTPKVWICECLSGLSGDQIT